MYENPEVMNQLVDQRIRQRRLEADAHRLRHRRRVRVRPLRALLAVVGRS
jgi:hypothetical protein